MSNPKTLLVSNVSLWVVKSNQKNSMGFHGLWLLERNQEPKWDVELEVC
jgi:hypothetical protein